LETSLEHLLAKFTIGFNEKQLGVNFLLSILSSIWC